MKVYAAIDLRGGEAVQLVGGDTADERVRLPDPAVVARRWLDAGFRRLHVVDLDAALGEGDNAGSIAAIAEVCAADPRGRRGPGPRSAHADAVGSEPVLPAVPVVLQVGGGVRDEAAIERVLELGAARAIVGTRAVEDGDWLERVARTYPGRLVVAADLRGGVVLTRGWTGATGRSVVDFVRTLAPLPLAGILVTDVGREGRQAGIDPALFRRVAEAAAHPVTAAGGITTAADLDALADARVDGAVLGMALYTGRLDPADALEREERDP